MVRRLFLAGVDVFRLNFSHGNAADHGARYALLRDLERETGRPIAILADLQGPKLRVGGFTDGPVMLTAGQPFRLDLDPAPGNAWRAGMPHPEIFAALTPGTDLLLDDGRLRLVVEQCEPSFAITRVAVGGRLSANKGVNVPGVVLPLTALTAKDRRDLDVALQLGVGLDRPVIRTASGGRRGGAGDHPRPSRHPVEAGKAGRGRAAGGDRGGLRRRDGGARRSGRRDAGRARAGHTKTHRSQRAVKWASPWWWPRRCSNP